MLTKKLLRITQRKGSLYPQFIANDDKQAFEVAHKLLELIPDLLNSNHACVESQLLEQGNPRTHPYLEGLVKIVLDRMQFTDTEDLEIKRWEILQESQKIRQETYFTNKEEFQETISNRWQIPFKDIADGLYADLPDNRVLNNFESWDAEALIHRYNCALVQGLLLVSPKINVKIDSASPQEKRCLFRAIKFHKLIIADIFEMEMQLSFSIAGPLSLLTSIHAYGSRLANFFPHLLLLKKWQIDAGVVFKKKECTLTLSHKQNLKSLYKEWSQHRPEEIEYFLQSYNQSSSDWSAQWCEEIVALEGQHFCCPDITLINSKNKKRIHIEFFHRWHRGELEKRIHILKKIKKPEIIIGIYHSLLKDDQFDELFGKKRGDSPFAFVFKGLPTPKAVNSILESRM